MYARFNEARTNHRVRRKLGRESAARDLGPARRSHLDVGSITGVNAPEGRLPQEKASDISLLRLLTNSLIASDTATSIAGGT